ncbi:MAG: hypothetical protein R3B07_15085 [Polyangiaceae bacterium]
MRLAVILASNYDQNPRCTPRPSCALDGDLMEDRLAEPDARFALERVIPRRKLKGRLERAFAGTEQGDTLLYFSGYARLSDGEAKLVLDDPRGGVFSVGKLCDVLGARNGSRLLVLELLYEEDDENPTLGIDLVDAVRQNLAEGPELSLLISARPAVAGPPQPSLLTRLFLLTLERAENERRALDATALYQRMREDPAFAELKVVGFFPAKQQVIQVLLEPRNSERPPASASDIAPISEAPKSSGRLGKPPPKPTGRSNPGMAAVSGPSSSQAPRSVPPGSVPPGSAPPSAAPLSVRPSAPPPPDPAELLAAGQYDAALVEYKKQLLKLGSKRVPEHAQVYIGMARAKAGQGKGDEALHNYDKALAITPLDSVAFAEAKSLVLAGGDIQRLSEWVRRRAEQTDDPHIKSMSLVELGKIWLEHQDPRKAVTALESACAADAANASAYLELAGAFSQLERPAQAIRALTTAGEVTLDHEEQARIWIRAAKLADDQLEGGEEVLELCRRALEADPSALEALELTSKVLAGRRRFGDLAKAYEASLERMPRGPVSFELAKRLGLLYRDNLDELEGAKRSFQRALECDPTALDLYYFVSELYEAEQQYVPAARQFQLAARHHPRNPDIYRRALWLFEKAGDVDAAWNAAVALETLGEADINESLLATEHRPEGAITPNRGLTPSRWQNTALGSASVEAAQTKLDAVFANLESAALRLATEHSMRMPWLDGATKQDPESTATLVRALGWAARLLGVEPPELWIRADWEQSFGSEIGVRILPSAKGVEGALGQPRVLAAQKLGSGLGPAELGFVWGRTLAGLVSPFELAEVYASDSELAHLLLAGLNLGGATGIEVDDQTEAFGERLEELLDDDAVADLEAAVSELPLKQVSRLLADWRRRLAFGRSRVGLLLGGDLETIQGLVERLPLPGASSEEILDDLRAFSISEPYLSLRQDLGIAVE